MKLTFIGADHEVTGSMHLIETSDTKILIDCGMEQGKNIYANAELPVSYKEIDYILLTHAHIDHAGMLPKAYLNGFNGTILTTKASADLNKIMLLDSAHIQEQEADQKNRKGQRAGKEKVEPAYTVEDAENCLKLFRSVSYNETIELSDTVAIRFADAGHLLGSASIEMWLKEGTAEKKIVFSGDIGNKFKPLIRDPQYLSEADYVVMESTYGNREHDKNCAHLEDMRRIIQETLDRGGNVLFPAFAVGRTQELLYFIRHLKNEHLIKNHDNFPVYVDSPLAVQATQVFKDNLLECYDEETAELVRKGINPITFSNLVLSVSTEDSIKINNDPTPKVIISAAGMCDAGRIRHHLKHNLWRRECSVVFAGYQAEGTLGRQLQDGETEVRLFGEDIHVAAHIENMGGMSSHADCHGLLEWISAFNEKPQKVFLVHGEDDAMKALSESIAEKTGFETECPYSGSVYDLIENRYIYKAEPVFISKSAAINTRNDSVRKELDDALRLLNSLAEKTKAGANADVRNLTEEIRKITERFS